MPVMLTAAGVVPAIKTKGSGGRVKVPHRHVQRVDRRFQCEKRQLNRVWLRLLGLWFSECHSLFLSMMGLCSVTAASQDSSGSGLIVHRWRTVIGLCYAGSGFWLKH